MSHGVTRPPLLARRPVVALLLATLPLPLCATTLGEAVHHAVTTHPEIAAANHERAATAEELARARGAYLPRVDASVELGAESSRSDASGRSDDSPTHRLSLLLNQSLYDPAKLSEIDRQGYRVNAAEEGLRAQVEEVALGAARAYLEVWRDEQVVALSKSNVSRHRATLAKVQGRLSAGEGGLGDVKQADSRLGDARATLADNRRILEQNRAGYQRAVGIAPEGLGRPKVEKGRLPATLEEALARTLSESPSLRRAQAEVEVADAALSAAQAGFLPTVNAELSATESENAGGVSGDRDDVTAMVVMRYNLYAGGGDRARKREAAARRLAAGDRLNALRRRLEEQTRRAWIAMERSDEKRKLLAAQQSTADRVVEIYRKEFEIGQHSLLDLLGSERERFNVRVRRIDADKEALLARYQLLAAMGRLAPSVRHAPTPTAPPNATAVTTPLPIKPTPAAPARSAGNASWVVLIADSRAAAEALGEQLTAKGYDHYIARLSQGRHGVSLGVYRERKYADEMVGKLRRHGYDATILRKQIP